jgi:hypothetical protein
MTGPDSPPALRRPSEEHPQTTITDQSQAVMLCLFRTCHWTSDDVRTMPREVQDEVAARHLLRAHEAELRALGQLAERSDLL